MTTPTRSGIPTTYNGTRFRSRLEAKWAALFDLIGWPWTYEPVDTAGYIPDFLIAGKSSFFVEVGANIDLDDYIDKASKPDATVAELRRDMLVVGVSPLTTLDSCWSDFVAAGWFGETCQSWDDALEPIAGSLAYAWGVGLWSRCIRCGAVGVIHSDMSYFMRPCGHGQDGNVGEEIKGDWLNALWRRAGNDTQWAGRRMVSMSDILRAVR